MNRQEKRAQKKQQRALKNWEAFLNKNPNVKAYFKAQDLEPAESLAQFNKVSDNVDASAYKKREKVRPIILTVAAFVIFPTIAFVDPSTMSIASSLVLSVAISALSFLSVFQSVQEKLHGHPFKHLRKIANDFATEVATVDNLKEEGVLDVNHKLQPTPLVNKDGKAIKITLK